MNRRENTDPEVELSNHSALTVDKKPGVYYVYHKKGADSSTESDL